MELADREPPDDDSQTSRSTHDVTCDVASGADVDLLARIRAGDRTAFDALYAMYARRLIGFAYTYVRSIETAQDIVANLFVHLWIDRDRWEIHGMLKAYLFAAIRRRALNYVRDQSRADRALALVQDDVATVMGSIPGPFEVDVALDLAARHAALRDAVAQLPPDRQRLVALRWREGLTIPDIAAIVGTSSKAVQQQLIRTIRALQKKLIRTP